MTVRAMIVDDEPLARSRLKRLLTIQGVEVVAEGENGQQAIDLVSRLACDVLFIDINMPVKNGLEAVTEINDVVAQSPAIVFCTAYDEHALEAFRTSAIAYLLKPIQAGDIADAIDKAATLSRFQINTLLQQEDGPKSLAVHYEGAMQNVPVSNFAYFHSEDKNVFGVFDNGAEVLIDKTLKSLEEELSNEFLRIHRSTLMNRQQALRLLKMDTGQTFVELKMGDKQLEVSRRHLSNVKKCFV